MKDRNESFMLIGLSSFSRFLARYLYERNFDVVAVDIEEERMEKVKKYLTKGIIGNVKDEGFLENSGALEVDSIIVSLGTKTDSTLIVVFNLLELGAKNIHVKVADEDLAKILKKMGDVDIIFPERDSAVRLAQRIDNPDVLDYIPLSDNYSIIDWTPSDKFHGKTLGELKLRNKYDVQVVSIENKHKDLKLIPKGSYVISKGDILVVIGENKHLEKLKLE